MKACILIVFSVFLLAAFLFARESTDIIVMKNGDRITCEIKGLSEGVLLISLPYILNTIEVDWSQVARLESHQLFLVKTEDGATYRGMLTTAETPAGRPVQIEIVETTEQKVELDQTRIKNGHDLCKLLAAIQRRRKLWDPLFQGQPVDSIQLRLASCIPARTLGGRSRLQFDFVVQNRRERFDQKPADPDRLSSDGLA